MQHPCMQQARLLCRSVVDTAPFGTHTDALHQLLPSVLSPQLRPVLLLQRLPHYHAFLHANAPPAPGVIAALTDELHAAAPPEVLAETAVVGPMTTALTPRRRGGAGGAEIVPMNCADASPDGHWIAAVGDCLHVALYPAALAYSANAVARLPFDELASRSAPRRFGAPNYIGCQYLAWSPDSEFLAASSDSNACVGVWRVRARDASVHDPEALGAKLLQVLEPSNETRGVDKDKDDAAPASHQQATRLLHPGDQADKVRLAGDTFWSFIDVTSVACFRRHAGPCLALTFVAAAPSVLVYCEDQHFVHVVDVKRPGCARQVVRLNRLPRALRVGGDDEDTDSEDLDGEEGWHEEEWSDSGSSAEGSEDADGELGVGADGDVVAPDDAADARVADVGGAVDGMLRMMRAAIRDGHFERFRRDARGWAAAADEDVDRDGAGGIDVLMRVGERLAEHGARAAVGSAIPAHAWRRRAGHEARGAAEIDVLVSADEVRAAHAVRAAAGGDADMGEDDARSEPVGSRESRSESGSESGTASGSDWSQRESSSAASDAGSDGTARAGQGVGVAVDVADEVDHSDAAVIDISGRQAYHNVQLEENLMQAGAVHTTGLCVLEGGRVAVSTQETLTTLRLLTAGSWTPELHAQYPAALRAAVRLLLLTDRFGGAAKGAPAGPPAELQLWDLPWSVLEVIIRHCAGRLTDWLRDPS